MNNTVLLMTLVTLTGSMATALAADGSNTPKGFEHPVMTAPSDALNMSGGAAHTARNARMKAMDSNRDGMISRSEYMTSNENFYDEHAKNPSGMINMNDMNDMYESGTMNGMDSTNGMDNMNRPDAGDGMPGRIAP